MLEKKSLLSLLVYVPGVLLIVTALVVNLMNVAARPASSTSKKDEIKTIELTSVKTKTTTKASRP